MNSFYKAKDVAQILDISVTQSYRIIKKLNEELDKKGYITIAGRIPKKYFEEKYYI
ncbi:transcriptional regulator [Clostridium botulinum]|uniref:transcriptional regulator n=1 Tax=Clostridium botulinum TaxID=1491 RepID=UPI001375FD6C|nr:transcriptional regulator [Clostridium botulinum]NCI22118.1 transcriptional regulator [Clostridium botulinum]NCI37842.1 transcriptional regulator [Clostridium botulinum]NCI74488.1 transcriptional regulator [Clostridium botulinum]NDI40963.1 transcriptional regulator [Clostridium botulinum]NFA75526.1 transcriptional regulator [Clostridium botulinum]